MKEIKKIKEKLQKFLKKESKREIFGKEIIGQCHTNQRYIEQLEIDIRTNLKEARNEPGVPIKYLAQMIREELGEDLPALIKELEK